MSRRVRKLLTPRWLLGHALVVLAVTAFLVLGWWQAGRAAEGNKLSWAYTFEWPLFAVFVIVVWIREMRAAVRELSPDRSPDPPPVRRQPVITRREANLDDGDPEYNRYLARLNEQEPHR